MQIHDVRLAVLLLLLGRCHGDDAALAHAGGEGMIVDILADADARLQHHAASFLQVQSFTIIASSIGGWNCLPSPCQLQHQPVLPQMLSR